MKRTNIGQLLGWMVIGSAASLVACSGPKDGKDASPDLIGRGNVGPASVTYDSTETRDSTGSTSTSSTTTSSTTTSSTTTSSTTTSSTSSGETRDPTGGTGETSEEVYADGRMEASVGCPVPTLEQCQDPAYLDADRCGVLQRKNKWTCAALLQGSLEEAADQQGKELSVVPKTFNVSGVDFVVKAKISANDSNGYMKPDLTSFHSQQAAKAFATIDEFAINEADLWEQNGVNVASCKEFAFERYYEPAAFERKAFGGSKVMDYRKAFDVAFGDWNDHAAIGTRHMPNTPLMRRTGAVIDKTFDPKTMADKPLDGRMFSGQPRPKNAFYAIPYWSGVKGAPSLKEALKYTSTVAAAALAKVEAAPESIIEDWSWHKAASDALSYKPVDPQKQLALAADTDDDLLQLLGSVPDKKIRKRLDKELDELADAQDKLKKLIQKWKELDDKYAGSGFQVSNLPKAVNINDIQDKPDDDPPDQLADPGFVIQSQERMAVLDAITKLLGRADQEGCLDEGLTPCDWSPKQFVRSVHDRFAEVQENEFQWCQEYSKGNLNNLASLDIHKIYGTVEGKPYECHITTDSQLTPSEVLGVPKQEAACRQALIEYKDAQAALQEKIDAQNAIRKIPELFDPKTGDFIPPGIKKSKHFDKGNDYFGLEYGYNFGWSAKLPNLGNTSCGAGVEAGGDMYVTGKVFKQDVPLLDAVARVNTFENKADVHLKVAGINVFDPIAEDWSDKVNFEWPILEKTYSAKKELPIVNTWITIVVVPVKLEAGISGEAGIKLGLSASLEDLNTCPKAKITGNATPFMNVSGYLKAGIDFVVVAVGIKGELTLIEAKVPFKASLGLQAVDSKDPMIPELALQASTSLEAELTTLSGSLSIYGKLGPCPLCIKGEKELVSWDGFTWKKSLFNQSYTVNLSDLTTALHGD